MAYSIFLGVPIPVCKLCLFEDLCIWSASRHAGLNGCRLWNASSPDLALIRSRVGCRQGVSVLSLSVQWSAVYVGTVGQGPSHPPFGDPWNMINRSKNNKQTMRGRTAVCFSKGTLDVVPHTQLGMIAGPHWGCFGITSCVLPFPLPHRNRTQGALRWGRLLGLTCDVIKTPWALISQQASRTMPSAPWLRMFNGCDT